MKIDFDILSPVSPKIAVQGYDSSKSGIYWNHASEILYCYSEKEAMGKKLEELILPPNMKDLVIQAIRNWHEVIPSSEISLKHKDGSDVPVDLIVLDMLMEPGMNGYQTYKEILKFNPDQKAIIASGFSENENVKAAIRIGAGSFMKNHIL
jgi:PAS domain S-box-containing protein